MVTTAQDVLAEEAITEASHTLNTATMADDPMEMLPWWQAQLQDFFSDDATSHWGSSSDSLLSLTNESPCSAPIQAPSQEIDTLVSVLPNSDATFRPTMSVLQVEELKTPKHPDPEQGFCHIRKTQMATIVFQPLHASYIADKIAISMTVVCLANLVDWVETTRNGLIYKRRNLEKDIMLEIELTIRAEGDVCPVCSSPQGMCGNICCKRPCIKAAKCFTASREEAIPSLRFEFSEAAVQPQTNLWVCAHLRLMDELTSTLLLDEAVAPARVTLLKKLP